MFVRETVAQTRAKLRQQVKVVRSGPMISQDAEPTLRIIADHREIALAEARVCSWFRLRNSQTVTGCG